MVVWGIWDRCFIYRPISGKSRPRVGEKENEGGLLGEEFIMKASLKVFPVFTDKKNSD